VTCHRFPNGIYCLADITEHRIRGRRVAVEWTHSGPWPLRRRDLEPWVRVPGWMWMALGRIAKRKEAAT
jgi:hypothetical protein